MLLVIILVIAVVYIVNNRRKREIDSITRVAMTAMNSGDGETAKKYMHMIERDRSLKDRLIRKIRSGIIWGITGLTMAVIYIIQLIRGTLDDHFLLMVAGVFIAFAAGNLIYGLAGRRMYAREIEAEERRNLEMIEK